MRASTIVPFAAIVALACEVPEASIGNSPEDLDGTGGEDADRGGGAGEGATDGTSGGAAGNDAGGATPAPGSLHFEAMGWRQRAIESECGLSSPMVRNTAVHGTSPTNVVVTGYAGCPTPRYIYIDHLVDDAFLPLVENVATGGLWAASPSLVFVSMGPSDDIVRIEDGQISREQLPISANVRFWGFSATDILAVGDEGLIFHRDAQQWSVEESGTQVNLSDVWGSGSEAFAVGEGGTVLHRVAGVWSSMESGTEIDLSDVWGTGPEDVYAVGGSGEVPGHVILHYDGVSWSIVNNGDARKSALIGVSGTSPSDVYVVGCHHDSATDDVPAAIHHWDGRAWAEISTQFATSDTCFSDIWCAQEDDCWIVGTDDALFHMTRLP